MATAPRAASAAIIMAAAGVAVYAVAVVLTLGVALIGLAWIIPAYAVAGPGRRAAALAWTTWLGPFGLIPVLAGRQPVVYQQQPDGLIVPVRPSAPPKPVNAGHTDWHEAAVRIGVAGALLAALAIIVRLTS